MKLKNPKKLTIHKEAYVLTMLLYIDIIITNPGALGAEETRQSIPNLAVKLCYGDNTVGGALWKNSSAPGINKQKFEKKFKSKGIFI